MHTLTHKSLAPKASKHQKFLDIEFTTNNYVAYLTKTPQNLDFHVIHDFLSQSKIGSALTKPTVIFVRKVKHIWMTVNINNVGDVEEPIITFHLDGIHTITPTNYLQSSSFPCP